MMVIYFIGLGLSGIACAFVDGKTALFLGLSAIGLFAGQILIAVLLVDVTRVDIQVVEAVEVLLVTEPSHQQDDNKTYSRN